MEHRREVISAKVEDLTREFNVHKVRLESLQLQLANANSELMWNKLKSDALFELVKATRFVAIGGNF